MNHPEIDNTTAKEGVSGDKIRSLAGLIYGSRAGHFDAFLEEAPTSGQLTVLSKTLNKPHIRHAVYDLDGTLVPPYAPIPETVIKKLIGYHEDGRNVAIYTNSPHSDRLNRLREANIAIAETGIGKPSLEGFKRLCDRYKMDPKATAMIGNFPVTDMPLVRDGDPPFFPLNILVESIPPEYRLIGSWQKYFRARCFHALNVLTARIVLARNRDLLKSVLSQNL
ncbi:hypothetical protein JXA05_03630 [Candidatus Peregrinibacteria bacterium]|nr:hypothetical protein [Candidatus Peregrinibacteria bacterium]